MADETYIHEIESARQQAQRELTESPINWLSLVGLFWFQRGKNTLGSAPDNDFILQSAPEHAGSFEFNDGAVTFHPVDNLWVTSNGAPLEARPLRTGRDANPDKLELGDLVMAVIIRGDETLLRVWDKNAPAYKNFSTLKFFPVNPSLRIQADFVRFEHPRSLSVLDAIGTVSERTFLGEVHFEVDGVKCKLAAQESGENLHFNFLDATSGGESYLAGRQLNVPKPDGDKVMLDFNLAENWPCAYTQFATCPMPREENRLPVRIEAGEMKYFAS